VNRALRVLRLEGDGVPEPETEIRYAEKVVGRVTSAARTDGGLVVLGYVRVEVPPDAELEIERSVARPLH
jgi:hypothetical protein